MESTAVYDRMEELQSQVEELKLLLQSTVQVDQRVPQMVPEKADYAMPREPRRVPTCYRCNRVGHISTKCWTKDVFCSHCKNSRHITELCRRKPASFTVNATANPAIGRRRRKSPESPERRRVLRLRQLQCLPLLQVVLILVDK